MEQKINLDTLAEFTWDFGSNFLLNTPYGCYIWSDPNYGGKNTIKPCPNPETFFVPYFGRAKGTHSIRDYCGENVKFEID